MGPGTYRLGMRGSWPQSWVVQDLETTAEMGGRPYAGVDLDVDVDPTAAIECHVFQCFLDMRKRGEQSGAES